MTPEQIKIVQSTWEKIVPQSEQAATAFYNKLFEIAPEVRPMFKNDMQQQGRELMQTLNTVVTTLNNLPELVPVVEELGRRHIDYGVEAKHYDAVATALIMTLESTLGDEFTAEAKEAWVTIYHLLANTMKEAATEIA